MFSIILYIAGFFTATMVQSDSGQYNILLQDCLRMGGCRYRGVNIAHQMEDSPDFKEGDRVYVRGTVKCHEGWGIDERELSFWITYRLYICNSQDLVITKEP